MSELPTTCPNCSSNLITPDPAPGQETLLMVSTVTSDMCLYGECPDCGYGWPMYTDGPYADACVAASNDHNHHRILRALPERGVPVVCPRHHCSVPCSTCQTNPDPTTWAYSTDPTDI